MKFDDGTEIIQVIHEAARQQQCLLFTVRDDWWFTMPIKKSRRKRGGAEMWILSSSQPDPPSPCSLDTFDLIYNYEDKDLGIIRRGVALVSLKALDEEEGKIPKMAKINPEPYSTDEDLQPKGVMKMKTVEAKDMPLYMQNVRPLGEEMLKTL